MPLDGGFGRLDLFAAPSRNDRYLREAEVSTEARRTRLRIIEPAGLPTLGPLGEERSLIAPVPAKGFAHSARDLPELAPAHSGSTVLFL